MATALVLVVEHGEDRCKSIETRIDTPKITAKGFSKFLQVCLDDLAEYDPEYCIHVYTKTEEGYL